MLAIIRPSAVKGVIQAPASKSSMQRACAAALISNGVTFIHNPGGSNDDKAALGVIHALGADVENQPDGSLKVNSKGVFPRSVDVNCGESGLGIRMFAPIIALSEKQITINGVGSLLSRPMDFFDEVLPDLDVQVISNNGKLPLKIKGPLQPKNIEIDGSLSSQFLTGLLMAYVGAGADGVAIEVKDLKSKPYIDLTLQVMRHFGWQVETINHKTFYFRNERRALQARPAVDYTVEGDWSGAAFLLVAGAIAGNISVEGLDAHSAQADKKILNALEASGCRIVMRDQSIDVLPSTVPLAAFHFDATDCPDLFPPLVALAAYCNGTSSIEGVSRLIHKESNRALTLQEEFGKMGVDIVLQGNTMSIKKTDRIKSARVSSHHDHRIAMACAIAALGAEGEVIIEDADAVNKSYPDFYEHLKLMDAKVELRVPAIKV